MERKTKIMIVEDETITAMSLRTRLKSLGYEVCGLLSTGEQAIKHMEKERPDLVIMDIILAGKIDGIEAVKEIQLRHNIPVIFITGLYDEEMLKDAKNVKSSMLLRKPFGPDDIENAIDQIINEHKSQDKP